VDEGTRLYAEREDTFGNGPDGDPVMRQVERVVMLRIIDQRWREHLREMDYLRDGIGLRAMGQRDPLTEWQREGFDMFGAMVQGISQDYVRYVMHVDVQVRQDEKADEPPSQVSYTAPADPDGGSEPASVARPAAGVSEGTAPPAQPAPSPTGRQQPVTKSAEEKLGRNDPCWCGSGKKFKACHGRRA
jgi:preprotein translocase subunit SecA